MRADYHLHSAFSEDCTIPMEAMTEAAISKGLDEICFTEHIDLDVPGVICCDCEAYRQEFDALKLRYEDRIQMRFGIEMGVQQRTVTGSTHIVNENDFDFVIMSCHQVDNQEFWSQKYQKGKTQTEYNRGYYEEILACAKLFKPYNIIGHLDAICRYDLEGPMPFGKIREIVAEILQLVIADGKGIEVNTSSFRYNLSDLTPSCDILRLYRDLGGEIITLGSDAHDPQHVGAQFEGVCESLKSLGYRHFCTFKKMQSIWHNL